MKVEEAERLKSWIERQLTVECRDVVRIETKVPFEAGTVAISSTDEQIQKKKGRLVEQCTNAEEEELTNFNDRSPHRLYTLYLSLYLGSTG